MGYSHEGSSGDVSRGDADAPPREVVKPFVGPTVKVNAASHGSLAPFPVSAYFDGDDKVELSFGWAGGQLAFAAWTDLKGLESVIGAFQATLDRARLELAEAALEASEATS